MLMHTSYLGSFKRANVTGNQSRSNNGTNFSISSLLANEVIQRRASVSRHRRSTRSTFPNLIGLAQTPLADHLLNICYLTGISYLRSRSRDGRKVGLERRRDGIWKSPHGAHHKSHNDGLEKMYVCRFVCMYK